VCHSGRLSHTPAPAAGRSASPARISPRTALPPRFEPGPECCASVQYRCGTRPSTAAPRRPCLNRRVPYGRRCVRVVAERASLPPGAAALPRCHTVFSVCASLRCGGASRACPPTAVSVLWGWRPNFGEVALPCEHRHAACSPLLPTSLRCVATVWCCRLIGMASTEAAAAEVTNGGAAPEKLKRVAKPDQEKLDATIRRIEAEIQKLDSEVHDVERRITERMDASKASRVRGITAALVLLVPRSSCGNVCDALLLCCAPLLRPRRLSPRKRALDSTRFGESLRRTCRPVSPLSRRFCRLWLARPRVAAGVAAHRSPSVHPCCALHCTHLRCDVEVGTGLCVHRRTSLSQRCDVECAGRSRTVCGRRRTRCSRS
jgi:hypothetical protein